MTGARAKPSQMFIALAFVAIGVVAAAFRFPNLAERPMHCDEAVHADKFGVLLEHGRYEYSHVDFHGPTLYYLTLMAARIRGVKYYSDLNEITLRAVPAFLGVLLAIAVFLFVRFLGFAAAAGAGLLTAVSPALVYYSRYYIQEILLVLLTCCVLFSVLRYFETHRLGWVIASGVLAGLMYATKETALLVLGCIAVAAALVILIERRSGETLVSIPMYHLAIAAFCAVGSALLLLTAFFAHPQALRESLRAFPTLLARGQGIDTPHVHEWSYYVSHLFFYRAPGGPFWSELPIALLSSLGLCVVFSNEVASVDRRALRFLALYTLLLVVVHSALPYKAPWNSLGFLHGMILLSGVGLAGLLQIAHNRAVRRLVIGLFTLGVIQLGWQAWRAGFPYAADPRNPLVYGHTGKDAYRIVKQVEQLASVYPGGHSLPIQIVSRENLWPLPWYLRRFSAVRWSAGVSQSAPAPPVILATPDMQAALVEKLYEQPAPGHREMYLNLFEDYTELRPGVEIRGYVAKSLWDEMLAKRGSY